MTQTQTSLSFTDGTSFGPAGDRGPRRQGSGLRPDALPDQFPEGAWPAIDVESDGLGRDALPVGIVVATADESRYFPFGHAEGRQHDPKAVRVWCEEHLAGEDLIFRNAKGDLDWLRRWGLDLEALGARPHEIQHPAALLDDRRRKFKLEDLAQDRLGRGKLAPPPGKIHELPADVVAPYAREDGRLTRECWFSYLPDIEREGLGEVLALEDGLIWSTMAMERAMAPIDAPKLERWIAEVTAEHQKRLMDIWRLTKLRVNPDSGRDMRKFLQNFGVAHTGFTTEKGNEAFTEEALLRHSGRYEGDGKDRRWVITNPAVHAALEARQLASLLSKYLLKYRDALLPGGLLPYQLHQLRGDENGTITGRYASSKVNIQQVYKPDKQPALTQRWVIRELFLAGEGADLLDADASQIEYRLFAHNSSVPPPHSTRLIEAYNDDPDTDFHQLVTDEILQNVMERVYAKNWNFRKLYGGGVAKSAAMTGLPLERCKEMDAQYDRRFPEATRLLRFCERLAERRGYVKTISGRRSRFQEGDRFYKALNSVLQGSAADIMKKKILRLYNERKTLEIVLRATVHDEVWGDRKNKSKKSARLLEECFAVQEYKLNVPITWSIGYGKNWAEAMT
jgi:DNA polymerase I-like protein with 3'-5' exonuclease and polymerase domains